MKEVIQHIMDREGITKQEATITLAETKERMINAALFSDYDEVEEILMRDLGLEADYIDIIFT